jgi:hypothetical protein
MNILEFINIPKLNYIYRVELLAILAIVVFVLYIFYSLNLFKK